MVYYEYPELGYYAGIKGEYDMKKRITRVLSLVFVLVIVASLMPSALAAGYRTKNGWIITTGDRLFTKTSTVTIKNTTPGEPIRVTITGISGCTVKRGPGASWDGGWVGSSFLISPQGSATFYINTKLGRAGCVDYRVTGAWGGNVSYRISAQKVYAYC